MIDNLFYIDGDTGLKVEEEWKDILGYEGCYRISNMGRVRSIDRISTGKNGSEKFSKGMLLKSYVSNTGYLRFYAYKNKYSKQTGRKIGQALSIHREVLKSFLREPSGKEVSNHLDGNRLNNNIKNLEWTDISGNTSHAHRTGLIDQRGEKNPASCMSSEQVIKVVNMLKIGKTSDQIIDEFKNINSRINRHNISNINTGKTWRIISGKFIDSYPIKRAEKRVAKNKKLKKEDVFKIRNLIREGIRYKDIGKSFNIGTSTVSRINKMEAYSEF